MRRHLECVNCGFCCRVAPCQFGEWNAPLHRCIHLTADNLCGRYDEIKDKLGAWWSPAFGAGCSSTIGNTMREAKIRAMEATK